MHTHLQTQLPNQGSPNHLRPSHSPFVSQHNAKPSRNPFRLHDPLTRDIAKTTHVMPNSKFGLATAEVPPRSLTTRNAHRRVHLARLTPVQDPRPCDDRRVSRTRVSTNLARPVGSYSRVFARYCCGDKPVRFLNAVLMYST